MQENNIVVGALTYDRFKETPDKTTYVSENHSVSSTDLMLLSRTIATSDSANAKSRVSFVRDIGRGTTPAEQGRIFANVEISYPQWASESQLQAITATVNAFLSSAQFGQLINKQSI